MTQALEPIRNDVAKLNDKIDAMDDRLKALQATSSHTRRLAAIVEL